MGYLLPWGQMSYWGAQVITSLFGAIPKIGEPLAQWLRGDYLISDATLNRFFAFHVIALPLVLLGLVVAHILALHEVGSNNPDGVEIKKKKDASGIPLDGIPFHPYYSVKDLVGVAVFMIVFAAIIFYLPEMGGWFLEPNNFIPANTLKTPTHIVPLWYFTPFYAILRAIPDKLSGVLAMAAAIAILFVLPWLDRHPVKSIRYRGTMFKWLLGVFAAVFLVLGYLGTQPPTATLGELGFRFSELYFSFFLILWVYSVPRSKGFYVGLTAALMALVTVLDVVRYEPAKLLEMVVTWLMPLGYYVAFLILPAFTRLNEPLPVPERVTSK